MDATDGLVAASDFAYIFFCVVFWDGFCEKQAFFRGFLWINRGEFVVKTW